MTTYTSLLSDDSQYGVEDWVITIRIKHAEDIPHLTRLRQMVVDGLDSRSLRSRIRVRQIYETLAKDFNRRRLLLSRNDAQLISDILQILEEELVRAGALNDRSVILKQLPSGSWYDLRVVGVARDGWHGTIVGRVPNDLAPMLEGLGISSPAYNAIVRWDNGQEELLEAQLAVVPNPP